MVGWDRAIVHGSLEVSRFMKFCIALFGCEMIPNWLLGWLFFLASRNHRKMINSDLRVYLLIAHRGLLSVMFVLYKYVHDYII